MKQVVCWLLFGLVCAMTPAQRYNRLVFRREPAGRLGYGTFNCTVCPEAGADVICLAAERQRWANVWECHAIFDVPVEIVKPVVECGEELESCNLTYSARNVTENIHLTNNGAALCMQARVLVSDWLDDSLDPLWGSLAQALSLKSVDWTFVTLWNLFWDAPRDFLFDEDMTLQMGIFTGLLGGISLAALAALGEHCLCKRPASPKPRRPRPRKCKVKDEVAATQEEECCVCKENRRIYAAVPCGHLLLCNVCFKETPSQCYLCNKEVEKLCRIFLPCQAE